MVKKARYFNQNENELVCTLCPHSCHITEGGTGRCLARAVHDGELIAESYGQATSIALDPIEKKPLRRFMPGSNILSLGSYGCNMNCLFCQNHRISRAKASSEYIPPEKLADTALKAAGSSGNIGVAFTYNEPLIWAEYILDTAPLLKERELKTILVTNGYADPEVIADLIPWVDAVNIDLKAFDDKFYLHHGGSLEPVRRTIEAFAHTCHVEITTLIVAGENDDRESMTAQVEWIAGISPDIPLHISRFFPHHYMSNQAPTPIEVMRPLEAIAKGKLHHVYLGNV